MAAHASVTARGTRARARHHSTLSWALPVTLGVILGWYATSIVRDGGVLTGGQLALGLISGAVLAVLCFGLGRMQKRLPRELRAAAYGALFGGSIGFLYSLSGKSVLAASVLGLLTGVGMLLAAFYVFYTHEN
ncbi:hypothetical protein [Streptomyces brevispora]|uniref:Uncharacterized protein n=1 Tax=Streptomyces brevispora TaxID=887462 RepID=A0A561UY27_9ACTN|nr:hypothetical protein [Streptomyces brevispora]TWG04247.1 hypothetical protein FHX80_112691 [Streptomyces brevispora]WSC14697.1 hypothetical protein OIE64_18885 [Streptomyces brevispora]